MVGSERGSRDIKITFAWKEGQFDNTLPSINLEKYSKTWENQKELHYFSLPYNFKGSNIFIHAWKPIELIFGIEMIWEALWSRGNFYDHFTIKKR